MKTLLNIFICSLLLAGNHLAGQTSNLIFEAKFENTLDSEEGESTTLDSGLSFEAGVSGMGALIEEGDVLQYAVQNNIDVSAGSMTLWVRPNWDPGDLLYRILVLGKDQRNFELHMDEGRSLAFSVNTFQIEGNPIKVAFADGSDWKKDNWYFLTYTWSADDAFNGALDTTFEVNLLAQGGTPVYHYEIIEGVLPAGLTLDGRTGKIAGTPEETGMFPVTFMVKDYNERSAGATLEATINITEMTTGLDEIPISQNLAIYPNPSTGKFTIVMDNDLKGSMDLIIFDPAGKQVRKITRNKTTPFWEETIDLGSMSSGTYLIKVRCRQNSATYKLIIK